MAMSFLPFGIFDVEYDRNAPVERSVQGEVGGEEVLTKTEIPDTRPAVSHVPLPESVKAIYMTSCVAGTSEFRQKLVKVAQETEINSIVIDIKDYSGTISFPPTMMRSSLFPELDDHNSLQGSLELPRSKFGNKSVTPRKKTTQYIVERELVSV